MIGQTIFVSRVKTTKRLYFAGLVAAKFVNRVPVSLPTGPPSHRFSTDLGGEQDGVVEADLHLAKSPGGGSKLLVSLPYIL